MKRFDMPQDLSAITGTTPNFMLTVLNKQSILIRNAIVEAVNSGETDISINVGYGNIDIRIDGEMCKYRFVPSAKLEKEISDDLQFGRNPLMGAIDTEIGKRLQRTYTELV